MYSLFSAIEKFRLDEKRSLLLEFSHFCELIFITEADKSVYKLLKWNCSNISIDTITWIWFRLAGTSCSADLHLIICSRIFRILSRFPKKIQVLKKKNSHLWWKNAQASVMNIKVVSKWKRHLTWDSDSDWGCKMSCQKTALNETMDPDTFKFYERLTSLLFKISPSS